MCPQDGHCMIQESIHTLTPTSSSSLGPSFSFTSSSLARSLSLNLRRFDEFRRQVRLDIWLDFRDCRVHIWSHFRDGGLHIRLYRAGVVLGRLANVWCDCMCVTNARARAKKRISRNVGVRNDWMQA